jgi:hypothetical protein
MCPDAKILIRNSWIGESQWMDGANMVCLQHPRASHYFRILLREQSNRQRVLTQIFSTIKGKSTKAIHMDAPPFIIALSF